VRNKPPNRRTEEPLNKCTEEQLNRKKKKKQYFVIYLDILVYLFDSADSLAYPDFLSSNYNYEPSRKQKNIFRL
jgi:hypothetical protein